jgi:phenylacetate-coenzyme A ligase PaaK-like adenylate-forming protein
MSGPGQWNHKVFGVQPAGFEALALELFRFQYRSNPVYKAFVQALRLDPNVISCLEQIPFLPIRFFKSHEVKSGLFEAEAVFESSGTTGSVNSKHHVKDISFYEESFIRGFEMFYGPVKDWCIIGLLPSYLERGNSSLVYMVDELIRCNVDPQSGFYLNEYEKLSVALQEVEKRKQKTFCWVSLMLYWISRSNTRNHYNIQ